MASRKIKAKRGKKMGIPREEVKTVFPRNLQAFLQFHTGFAWHRGKFTYN